MKKLSILIGLAFLASCSSPKNKAFEELVQHEKSFYSKYRTVELKKEDSKIITDKYEVFLKENPKFEGNDEIMLRFADVYMGTKQYFLALGIFDQFSKTFPNHKKSAYVLFNKGFACELAYKGSKFNKHRDFSKSFYNEFLEKYPKHSLVGSVNLSLKEMDAIEPKITK